MQQSSDAEARGTAAQSGYRFKAFVSYRRTKADRAFANWLQSSLESYRTPAALVKAGFSPRVGTVFQDEDELAATPDIAAAIESDLDAAEFLIVICSPAARASTWVEREIGYFQRIGRSDKILAALIEGEPSEAFPTALLGHAGPAASGDNFGPLAADFRKTDGLATRETWRLAKLKLIATLIGCRFDQLVAREQARRRKILITGFAALCSVLVVIVSLAMVALLQRNEARAQRTIAIEQRDNALVTQSRFLTDLSTQATDRGDGSLGMLLALEALPKSWPAGDRPFYPPAMTALYQASVAQREILSIGPGQPGFPARSAVDVAFDAGGSKLLVGTNKGTIELWDTVSRQRLSEQTIAGSPIHQVVFGKDDSRAWAIAGDTVFQLDLSTGGSQPVYHVSPDPIEAFSVSPNGSRLDIISGSQARMLSAKAGAFRAGPPADLNSGLIYHSAFSPDGRSVVSGDSQTDILAFTDLETGEKNQIKISETGESGSMFTAFDPSGRMLLVSTGQSVAALIDITENRRVATLAGHQDTILQAAFNVDGSLIATGSQDGTVKLWSRENNFTAPVASFGGFRTGGNEILDQGPEIAQTLLLNKRMHDDFEGAVTHLAFSLDGKRLLATSGDRAIYVFDVEKRSLVVRVSGHSGRIDRALISPDGSLVATVGRDGTAKLWHVTDEPRSLFYAGGNSVQKGVVERLSARGPLIALVKHSSTCKGDWKAWNLDKGELIGGPAEDDDEGARAGSISIDGSTLVTWLPQGPINVHDLATGRTIKIAPPAEIGALDCIHVGPAGQELLISGERGAIRQPVPRADAEASDPNNRQTLRPSSNFSAEDNILWMAANPGMAPASALEEAARFVGSSINRNGTRLLAERIDGQYFLFDTKSGKAIRNFTSSADAANDGERQTSDQDGPSPSFDGNALSFSDDGQSIVGLAGQKIRIWSAADGKLIRDFTIPSGLARAAALGGLPQTWLSVINDQGYSWLYRPDRDDPGLPLGEGGLPVNSRVVISPDGKRGITETGDGLCENAPQLWDLSAQRKIGDLLSSGAGCTYQLEFSGDGSAIVGRVTEPDGLVVWESERGSELIRRRSCLPDDAEMYDAQPTDVMASGFSEDARYIYAGTLYGSLCVWTNPGAGQGLIERSLDTIPRELTAAERAKYPLSPLTKSNPDGTELVSWSRWILQFMGIDR
ncbi:toll/interleukin-1 receptor domain-containing protein (plasmid) [Rhizobium leguminosarum]